MTFQNSFPCYSTLVELLRHRASQQPELLAFTFLADGETESNSFTYQDLDHRSRAITAQLQAWNLCNAKAWSK